MSEDAMSDDEDARDVMTQTDDVTHYSVRMYSPAGASHHDNNTSAGEIEELNDTTPVMWMFSRLYSREQTYRNGFDELHRTVSATSGFQPKIDQPAFFCRYDNDFLFVFGTFAFPVHLLVD